MHTKSAVLDKLMDHNYVYAMKIKERIDTFREKKINIETDRIFLDDWISKKSITTPENIFEKLKIEGVSKDEFSYVVKPLNGVDIELLFDKVRQSDWFMLFKEIMCEFISNHEELDSKIYKYDSSFPLRPFIYWATLKMRRSIKELKNIVIPETVLTKIIQNITNDILKLSTKSIIWELHQYKASTELVGDTPEDRFEDFIQKKFKDMESLLDFYRDYPTLIRSITNKLNNVSSHYINALNRLDKNFYEIQVALQISLSNNEIKDIDCGIGDTHQKSQSVIQFVFDDSIIIYKPRNLQVAKKFYEYVSWFNNKSRLEKLPVNLAYYGEEYVFEKFIKYKGCNSEEEVERYYKRFGQTIALIYTLCGNDFHLENVIANGEFPYLVDLECLFQQTSELLKMPDNASTMAFKGIHDSVSVTGFLPLVGFNNNVENKGIDISALNGGKQKLPFKVLGIKDVHTDMMRFEYQEFVRDGSNNIPMLNSEKVNYRSYTKFILEGFKNASKFIIDHKEELLGDDGLINIFNDVVIRHLTKGTQVYSSLMSFSDHPNYTKDYVYREKLLENSWAYPYKDKRIIKYEVEDMLGDDIPIFFGYPNSRDIISSDGRVEKDYFEKSSLERVRERISKLHTKEVEKQISFMIVSFGEYEACSKKILEAATNTYNMLSPKSSFNKKYDLMKYALAISEILQNKAIVSEDKKTMTWIDVLYNNDNGWQISPLDESLYCGLSGVALFYHYLYRVTEDKKNEEISENLLAQITDKPLHVMNLSSYYGISSVLYPLALKYIYTQDEKYRELIDKINEHISKNVDRIKFSDWISGKSGLIYLLINIYEVLHNGKYLETAIKLGDSLISDLEEDGQDKLLGGMAHGASGICLALFKLSKYYKNRKVESWAIKLLDYDRSLFDHEKCGWLDIRGNKHTVADKWCHGSTGIGMSRLELCKIINDSNLNSEIEIAARTIFGQMKNDDCLCHGNMGDVDFLLNYYKYTNKEEVLSIINSKTAQILKFYDITQKYKITGIPQFTSLGLFTGLAGIGYQLLRIMDPYKVPSVLTLELI